MLYMKSIENIRLKNLLLLIEESGTQERLAERTRVSRIYLNQIKNQRPDPSTGKVRNIGSQLARKLESSMNKPIGWMDQVHDLIDEKLLDQKLIDDLYKRGIIIKANPYGTTIELTTVGMYWLFNYLYTSGNIGVQLSFSLLNRVAKVIPDVDSWREIRFKYTEIPVYQDQKYYQLTCYLNGSPPRAFHAFVPNNTEIHSIFDVPFVNNGVFKIKDDQIVQIHFADDEIKQLERGDLISKKLI